MSKLQECANSPSSTTLGKINHTIKDILERMEVDRRTTKSLLETLPFTVGDTTAGSEMELQAVVAGRRQDVDLPLTIERSNYFANVLRRAASGDSPRKIVLELIKYLEGNRDNIWENSWVRFPKRKLNSATQVIFHTDLLADKKKHELGLRSDVHKFIFVESGEEHIRVPISYVLKLALADVLNDGFDTPPAIRHAGLELLNHFLCDNTSPETHSFYVMPLHPTSGMGRIVAFEAATRFLLTQLLISWANEKFGLRNKGQRAMVFLSPHPPVRQKQLNDCISDGFYRDLFMNPCLSGWDQGEAKYHYMHLCHEVLSRSQLHAVKKLREAGILNSNLIVLPNLSNISLANNGTHVSLGSQKLTILLSNKDSAFTEMHEKYIGDLVIKIVEHFLPLFVGSYSTAPYRIDFAEFHPEKVLGFLPHEIDYTHLRMFWRRWKKKAKIKFLGHPITPFGPDWLDRLVGKCLGLRGDFVPDFRLIDYLVSLMSTESSPALNGIMGNGDRLKKDLADMGIFSTKMSLYLLYKLREYSVMGYSGFEGRHYSLFESFGHDMGRAVDLQNLITALAMQYIAQERLDHPHIPDDPFIESERRQVLFGTAVGLPTFFVRSDTKNLFIKRIISKTKRIRASRRYPGFLRVYNCEYRLALIDILEEDARDLIEMMNLRETIRDLRLRILEPDTHSAQGKITQGICSFAGIRTPFDLDSREFNLAAEKYYRDILRRRHMEEAFEFLAEDLKKIHKKAAYAPSIYLALCSLLLDHNPSEFLTRIKEDAIEDRLPLPILKRLILIITASILLTKAEYEKKIAEKRLYGTNTSVYRTGNE
ncbi:MAG: hypothetical protein N2572_02430 [Syntrophales bacterium]|nr:hypothetical protein [Syntrophales bacterium]